MTLLLLFVLAIGLGQYQNMERNRGRVDLMTRTTRFLWTVPGAALGSGVKSVRLSFANILSARQLVEENRALRQKIQAMSEYSRREDLLLEELERTRKLAQLPAAGREKVTAQVISAAMGDHRVRLNVGANQGIKAGQPVVDGGGLVGQVAAVEPGHCDVTLVSSPTLRLSCLVVQSDRATSRAIGLVRGESIRSLLLDVAEPGVVLSEGDVVVTTGLTAAYPRGIVIGDVIAVQATTDLSLVRAVVSPRAGLDSLSDVVVLK